MVPGREALIRDNWERRKGVIIAAINKYGDCHLQPNIQPEIVDWPDAPAISLEGDPLVFKINVVRSPGYLHDIALVVCEGVELASFEISRKDNLRQERADILHSSQR